MAMSKTKYQIFVSSTYEDLKPQRETVIKAILELGQIPVGMEMFSAGDEQQWELIKRQIDDSDYYIVLIAHRYGSTHKGISYTEKEYDYAVSIGVPTLAFVISDESSWPAKLFEGEPKAKTSLAKFKKKVKKKIIDFWREPGELHGKISIAIAKAMTAYPRPGWVRSGAALTPEITNELSRLSKENGQLRTTVENLSNEIAEVGRETEEKAKITAILEKNPIVISIKYKGRDEWTPVCQSTLFQLFFLLAPLLTVEMSYERMSTFIATMLDKKEEAKAIDLKWPIAQNSLAGWLVNLQSLQLVTPSRRKHAVSDKAVYWSLTELGSKVHSEMLRADLEEGIVLTERYKDLPIR
jgi:hypothetical protein